MGGGFWTLKNICFKKSISKPGTIRTERTEFRTVFKRSLDHFEKRLPLTPLHAKYPNPDEVHCDILMTSKKGLHDASGPQEGYLISLYTAFWAFCLERNFMPLLFDTRGEFLTNLLQFGGKWEIL